MGFRGEKRSAEKPEAIEERIDPQVTEIAAIFNDQLNQYIEGTGTETYDDAFRAAAIEAITKRVGTLPLHQQIGLFNREIPESARDKYMQHLINRWQELDERGKVIEVLRMEAQRDGRVDKDFILPGSTVEIYLHDKSVHDAHLRFNRPFSFAEDPYLYALILTKTPEAFELQQIVPHAESNIKLADIPISGEEITIKTNMGSGVPTMGSHLYVGGAAYYSQNKKLHYLNFIDTSISDRQNELALGEIIIDGVPMFEDKIRRPSR